MPATPGSPSPPAWPVTTVTEVDRPRWVTGIPARAGTAKAEETPGTTSQAMPAASSASASSPPRPNTNGSPPFSRTTVLPAWPSSINRALISAWERAWGGPPPPGELGRLPTSMSSAPGPARARTPDR